MEIKRISPEHTWTIRHQVMWPKHPIEFVKLEKDTSGAHYGIFVEDKLVSCISLFIADDLAQFRKLATLHGYQKKGYASALIDHIIAICLQKKVQKIWCNARLDKTDFYENFGLIKTKNSFSKEGVSYLVMERIL
ncbi:MULTISPECIES: GNAT family N-acetyltransferase [Maribacter]|uniref:GNAT family N-acetyltransferase n=1 Tax=Maribacter flavus TaxID=1658664 RepID=A0ABU7IIX4_9FLAO|nr:MULTISPECIES: GNAT family N-acetyltransferase [Maribacter]MDC6405423.1 GNAT family N-acetyltransferase [Maribacter sp. PR66]MEE1972809.1 GNAT family N-acetyltransferase [Maribacter flavus]